MNKVTSIMSLLPLLHVCPFNGYRRQSGLPGFRQYVRIVDRRQEFCLGQRQIEQVVYNRQETNIQRSNMVHGVGLGLK